MVLISIKVHRICRWTTRFSLTDCWSFRGSFRSAAFSERRVVFISVDRRWRLRILMEMGLSIPSIMVQDEMRLPAPPFVNLDLRFTKRFNITERVKIHALFEFFNVFNRQNPAAVEKRQNVVTSPFGSVRQVLPGREGQVGLRFEF